MEFRPNNNTRYLACKNRIWSQIIFIRQIILDFACVHNDMMLLGQYGSIDAIKCAI